MCSMVSTPPRPHKRIGLNKQVGGHFEVTPHYGGPATYCGGGGVGLSDGRLASPRLASELEKMESQVSKNSSTGTAAQA